MKRILPGLICVFFTLSAAAVDQDSIVPPIKKAKTKNSFLLSSEFFFASNALTNELAKTYYLNGFITDDMKDEVSSHLSDRNRLGGEFNTEIYFKHAPDTLLGRTDLSWFIGVKNINHINASFTRDLFEVYFRGNKNYAGKTADFSGFNYMLLKYQQLQFGLAKSILNDSASIEMGAAIGFNIGQQMLRIESSKAEVFTEEIGEYLDVNATVNIHNSDSLRKNFGSFNGFGFSTDLFYKEEIKKRYFFSARISNIGFIRWNDRSVELKADSTFRFEGVDVSSLLNFADTVRSTITFDSTVARPFLSHRKYKTYTMLLPAKIEVSYKETLGDENIRAGMSAAYILDADYYPLVSLDGDYTWQNNRVGLSFSYGGYTTLGTGVYFQHFFHHGCMLAIGSNYLNSFFDLDKSIAESIHVTFHTNF